MMTECPDCGADVADPTSGCTQCEIFLCDECRRWVPWQYGAADEDPDLCDSCVAAAYREIAQATRR